MAKPNYDEIIDQLSEDQDFLKLPEDQQDSLVEELAQERMGVIPKSENILERAIKKSGTIANDAYSSLYNFTNTASFGAVDAARELDNKILNRDRQAPHAESGIGKVAEIGSGLAGFIQGGPGKLAGKVGSKILPKVAVKRTLPGFIARSLSRAGEGAVGAASLPGSLDERASAAKTGAIVAPVLGGITDTIFGRQAGLARKKEVGKTLGNLKNTLADSGADTDPHIISAHLDEILNSNKFERGISRTGLKAIKNTIDDIAAEGRNLTPKEMMQVEEQLGRVGIFQNPMTGYPQKDITAPNLNIGAKEIRNLVSGEVDDLAAGAGIKDFGSVSQEFSDLAKRFPDKKTSGISSLIRAMKVGLLSGAMGGQNVGAAGAVVDSFIENPKVKKGIYDILSSSFGKNLGRAGISYGASLTSKKN